MAGLAQNYSTAECDHRPNIFQKITSNGYPRLPLVMLLVTSVLILGCQPGVSRDYNKGLMSSSYSADSVKQADEVASIRTQMAAQYLQYNDLDGAKRQLEKALLANKRYAPAYDMMGVLLQTEGSPLNLEKAESYFQKALTIDPQLMKARNNYGVYLAQLGRYDEANKQFTVAGSALGYVGRIKALENLGMTALKADNYSLATETFVRILERDRDNLVAHLELVDLLISSEQWDQAKDLYRETLLLLGNRAGQIPRVVTQGIKLGHPLDRIDNESPYNK